MLNLVTSTIYCDKYQGLVCVGRNGVVCANDYYQCCQNAQEKLSSWQKILHL